VGYKMDAKKTGCGDGDWNEMSQKRVK